MSSKVHSITREGYREAWRERDGRTVLIHGTALIAGTGVRVLCALLRAATLPVTPWRVPALQDGLGGGAHRLLFAIAA